MLTNRERNYGFVHDSENLNDQDDSGDNTPQRLSQNEEENPNGIDKQRQLLLLNKNSTTGGKDFLPVTIREGSSRQLLSIPNQNAF